MARKNATIYDIAKLAKTSTATVSRVLSNSGYPVKEELRQRVLEAAKKLNYTPNLLGRQLKTKETRDIAVIIPNISNPFYPSIVLGVEDAAREKGYNVLLCDSYRNPQLEIAYLNSMAKKQVRGIIISSISQNQRFLKELVSRGFNIVAFDQNVTFPCNRISFDYVKGGFLATEHLIKLGHKKIAFISAPLTRASRKGVFEGYLKALKHYKLDVNKELILINDKEQEINNEIYEYENGIELVKRFLKIKDMPTAIFAVNDMTAIGVIQGLKSFGVKVPDDVSVVGFDNIFISEMIEPPLTTIEQPKYEMGKLAATLLIDRLQNEGDKKYIEINMSPTLIIRKSTKPL
ncbi:LacI family DNA-binding transcriptional regulator [Thermosediminibacter litoriperuensis]|uniref:LacI family transcriptional regulator n=1 Tax=Thermosediminibacter litoriperuensis TaxID=291989 RepID=A0A5S5AFY0_9FIRM|nr:LacI family DNA-binding transcriptional regulator [Thermosediminibacter litoriperuensis]TYP47889.1 LacI family transcriptional regulator [Thermosediminibacter litoriperuensis]